MEVSVHYSIWLDGVRRGIEPLLTDIYEFAIVGFNHSKENHLQATWFNGKDIIIYNKQNNNFSYIPQRDEEKIKKMLYHDLIVYLKNKNNG